MPAAPPSAPALAAAEPRRTRGCCAPVPGPMAAARAAGLAAVFAALADPTRIQIVHILRSATEPVCVCDLTAAFGLSQPTVSHHLGRLRAVGIATSTRRGIWSFYRLADPLSPLVQAALDAAR